VSKQNYLDMTKEKNMLAGAAKKVSMEIVKIKHDVRTGLKRSWKVSVIGIGEATSRHHRYISRAVVKLADNSSMGTWRTKYAKPKEELVKALKKQGYPSYAAKVTADDLLHLDSTLVEPLKQWLKNGQIINKVVQGYSIKWLMDNLGQKFPSALLVLDGLIKDPKTTTEAINYGIKHGLDSLDIENPASLK